MAFHLNHDDLIPIVQTYEQKKIRMGSSLELASSPEQIRFHRANLEVAWDTCANSDFPNICTIVYPEEYY